MNIYEIDQAITELIDEETGEVSDFESFDRLFIARNEKIEGIALWYKNLAAEAKAIKEEKMKLAERQTAVEKKAESAKKLLDYALQGEKFESPRASVSYRKSSSVSLDAGFVDWAKENARDLLTYTEPKPSLTAIKQAIGNGREVDFASITVNQNITVK